MTIPDTPAHEAARARALRNLAEITPEEGAALTAAAEADPDNPPVDEATMATMRPADAELIRMARRARAAARGEDPDEAPDLSTPEWQAKFDAAPVDRGRAEVPPTDAKKQP